MKTTAKLITVLLAVLIVILTLSFAGCTKVNDKNTLMPPEIDNQTDDNQLGLEGGQIDNKGEFESKPLSWKIYDTTFSISGNGDMDEIFEDGVAPWQEYNERFDKIVIEEGVMSISNEAFKGCAFVEYAEIADSVLSIGDNAFARCNFLREIDLPDNLTSIGQGAFSNCVNAKEIDIPDSLKRIESAAFANCFSVPEIDLGDVEYIGENAFAACHALTKIELGANLTEIADGAFQMCDNLKVVEFDGSKAQWEKVKIGANNDAIKNANVKFDK